MSLIKKFTLLLLIGIVVSTSILTLGSPQWGKWFYMWQAYILNNETSFLEVPQNYEGIWSNYYPSGKLATISTYKDGKLHGPFTGYTSSGELELILLHDVNRETKTIYSRVQNIDERHKYVHLLNNEK